MEAVQATQLLRNDHKVVKGLFTQATASGLRAQEMSSGVIRELFMMLEIHTRIEEEIFYPALAENSETAAIVDQSFGDHREAKELIQSLRSLDIESAQFNNGLVELMASIELHVTTEESELFPLAERALGTQLMELGVRMQELKDSLMSSEQYRDARPEVVQDPNGGEQIRKHVA